MLLPTLTLLPMLMFVSLPTPGRFPPILGRLISMFGRLTLLPKPGRLMFPPGRFPPITGLSILPGNVLGRNEGRAAMEGFEGSVVGREMFGRFPAPPNEGREPPKDGVPEFPPRFGIEGRAFAFPNDGRDIFGALGLAMLGMLGRDMFGRAPPPPTLAIDGLAPPPPPPPRPRCAKTSGSQIVPMTNGTNIADTVRIFFNVNMLLFRELRMDYLPTVGGSLTTVI